LKLLSLIEAAYSHTYKIDKYKSWSILLRENDSPQLDLLSCKCSSYLNKVFLKYIPFLLIFVFVNRLFCTGFLLFLLATTIILSLIPLYLSKSNSINDVDNGPGMFYGMIIMISYVLLIQVQLRIKQHMQQTYKVAVILWLLTHHLYQIVYVF
jgi:hypothetical protein